MKPTIIAIDPGASGGIAISPSDAATCYAQSMWETEGDVVEGLRLLTQYHAGNVIVYIEEVGGFIGSPMPGSRMFTFGRGFGFLLGVLQALSCRIELVRPQKWQKALSLGTRGEASKNEWKAKLKAHAQRLYPHIKVTLATADALLILDYGRKQNP